MSQQGPVIWLNIEGQDHQNHDYFGTYKPFRDYDGQSIRVEGFKRRRDDGREYVQLVIGQEPDIKIIFWDNDRKRGQNDPCVTGKWRERGKVDCWASGWWNEGHRGPYLKLIKGREVESRDNEHPASANPVGTQNRHYNKRYRPNQSDDTATEYVGYKREQERELSEFEQWKRERAQREQMGRELPPDNPNRPMPPTRPAQEASPPPDDFDDDIPF